MTIETPMRLRCVTSGRLESSMTSIVLDRHREFRHQIDELGQFAFFLEDDCAVG